MSEHLVPDPMEATVLLPVVLRDGQWRVWPDHQLPRVREGTQGRLIIPRFALLDKTLQTLMKANEKVQALSANTVVRLRLCQAAGAEKETELRLLEPLQMIRTGAKRAQCGPCRCLLLRWNEEAASLNHAYTLASEHLEKGRRTHGGNVFRKVFYSSEGDQWRPLMELRDALFRDVFAADEHVVRQLTHEAE